MKKLAQNIVKHRFLITAIVALLTVYTFTLMDDVNTNYDFSEYLPLESQATIDTNAVRDQIDFPIDISLMVNDITKDEVSVVKDKLQTIDEVEVVVIDENDSSNYKDGHALFVVFLDSDTEDISIVINKIEDQLSNYDINLSGNYVNTYHQQEKVADETPIIMIVACAVIFLILLVTTKRYLEPLAFGLVIGVAIVLNMGTNIIFDDISYITKSVAAVLQLGLSMDYSIILIHNYYLEKETTKDNKEAMITALSNSFKPVSSSSLTTVIGLLALLFMSFTIGTDMGLVLAKGIIISLVCVFVLLPNIILWLEKVPFNKEHKTLNISKLAVKSSNGKVTKGITAFAFIFIIAMFFVQSENTYLFTDETKFDDEEAIKEVFGDSNTLVIGIKNNENLYDNEQAIMNKIESKYSDSIISYLGEVNSVQKRVSYKDLIDLTTEENAKLILSAYALNNGTSHQMTYLEYTNTLEALINNETIESTEELSDFSKVIVIKNMLNESYTSEELLNTGLLGDTVDQTMIDLVFNSYQFDNGNTLTNSITLNQFITTLELIAQANPTLVTDTDSLTNLVNLKTQLASIEGLLNSEVTKTQFAGIALSQFGVTLDTPTLDAIYSNYFLQNSLTPTETIKTENILQFMSAANMLSVENNTKVQALITAKTLVNTPVLYTELNTTLNSTVQLLTGTPGTSDLNSSLVKFVYVFALDNANAISKDEIAFTDLVPYLTTLSNDPFTSTLLPEAIKTDLVTLNTQMALLNSTTEYTKTDLTNMLSDEENEDLNKLSTLLYSTSLSNTSQMNTYEVSVSDLLEYITSNDLGLTDAELTEITALQSELNTIESIISSDELSLIVLNTTFPYESEETREFIDFVYKDVYSTVDEETYFIGYSVSDTEIKGYFEDDILKINFITIGAVLLILIITFQSVIIPVLLVFTIEGAIWTTLSISYFTSEPIFFFCYIVIGAIQLGATIDYAIILTTNYQKARLVNDKKVALSIALKQSVPAILTSGTILTIAGFAIALVSTQASIVSVGSFLGKGTLISMIYVVTILPSMLYTFDTLIIKTQNKKEQAKTKLKKKYASFL